MIPVGILFKKVTEYRCSRTVKVYVMVWIDGDNEVRFQEESNKKQPPCQFCMKICHGGSCFYAICSVLLTTVTKNIVNLSRCLTRSSKKNKASADLCFGDVKSSI